MHIGCQMDTAAPFVLHVLQDKFILEPPLNIDSGSCLAFTQAASESKDAGTIQPGTNLKICSETRSAVLTESGRKVPVYAVLGFFFLLRGPYVAIVTRTKRVGKLPNGAIVQKILHVDVLPVPVAHDKEGNHSRTSLTPEQWDAEAQYLSHIRHVTNSGMLYFSHGYDLTNTAQRNAEIEQEFQSSVRTQRADPRFFWNRHLVSAFVKQGLHQWIHPVISGHVSIHSDVPLTSDIQFDYAFISRRSCGNQGTRFNVRGLDNDGRAANFVESEQMIAPVMRQITVDESSNKRVLWCSYVQTRGSIPVAWSQKVTLKYMPRTKITATAGEIQDRFEKHFGPVTAKSGEHSLSLYDRVVAVNLIDKTGKSRAVADQRELGELYQAARDKMQDDRLRVVWFDFHHECRKMQWGNLSKLVDQVKTDLKQQNYFVQAVDGSILKTQSGVFRTNCMDNLDRTNVVQSLFARQVALEQFRYLVESYPDKSQQDLQVVSHAVNSADVLNSPFASFEFVFKNVWADNADAMSILYSGTPALKTDFTRTGKRTKQGLLKDGWNSVKRYYINNFDDGRRQDAVDLFLGKVQHVDSKDKFPRNRDKYREPFKALLMQLAGFYLLVLAIISLWLSTYSITMRVFLATTTWLSVVAVGANRVLKSGASHEAAKRYVNYPSYST